jgi:hypothetical protein
VLSRVLDLAWWFLIEGVRLRYTETDQGKIAVERIVNKFDVKTW